MAEQRPPRGIVRRTARTLRSKLHGDVVQALDDVQQVLRGELRELRDEVGQLRARVDAVEVDTSRATAIARHAYDEEPANRRRLHELRRSEEYELAFTETEPLVSFLIPTYTSYETLRDVALPSVLGQSYSNLEVIVSGDCAPAETAAAIAEIGDPRVVYLNRTIRGPYPEDPAKRWFGIGGPPFNDALAIARGRWIAILGDDDAVRPNHTTDLISAAQEKRYEHCYGLQLVNFPEGEPLPVGKFPPEHGHWGPQSCIYHSGLRYFESELSDAIYDEPSDWSKCRRMIRAGVRFGMIDKIVADKHETRRRSAQEWAKGEVPIAD
jgi:glycosyl transferase family 2